MAVRTAGRDVLLGLLMICDTYIVDGCHFACVFDTIHNDFLPIM